MRPLVRHTQQGCGYSDELVAGPASPKEEWEPIPHLPSPITTILVGGTREGTITALQMWAALGQAGHVPECGHSQMSAGFP